MQPVKRDLMDEFKLCELDETQPAQVCKQHGHPINCPTPLIEDSQTIPFTDSNLEAMMTPTNSPSAPSDSPDKLTIIISDTDETDK